MKESTIQFLALFMIISISNQGISQTNPISIIYPEIDVYSIVNSNSIKLKTANRKINFAAGLSHEVGLLKTDLNYQIFYPNDDRNMSSEDFANLLEFSSPSPINVLENSIAKTTFSSISIPVECMYGTHVASRWKLNTILGINWVIYTRSKTKIENSETQININSSQLFKRHASIYLGNQLEYLLNEKLSISLNIKANVDLQKRCFLAPGVSIYYTGRNKNIITHSVQTD